LTAPPSLLPLQSLAHNVVGGKLNRGLSVIDSVEILKGRPLTDDEYLKAAVLGWCVELLQAYFLISDDMMDRSITRRGQPCWYLVENVGSIAINDAFILEAAIYHLLKTHFRGQSCYVDLLEVLHQTTYQTTMGQLVDLITAPEDVVDLSKFSLEKHTYIIRYKTAYYSFYLPVALAMYMCNLPTTSSNPNGIPKPYDFALSILVPLGEYFQIQDDFMDYSVPPEKLGKVGTDIIDNKCSWCINTALAVATPAQREILDTNYGIKNPVSEQRVKDVYNEIGLPERYAKYEEDAYQRLNKLIESIPEWEGVASGEPALKREVFTSFLGKIYKRSM